jgi:hypothetical protein
MTFFYKIILINIIIFNFSFGTRQLNKLITYLLTKIHDISPYTT